MDSRKLLTQISTAGRTDFKVKKKIPKAAEIDENFEIPEINMEDLTDMMNGNTARPQDITLRERQEEFLTFDEEMLDFSVRRYSPKTHKIFFAEFLFSRPIYMKELNLLFPTWSNLREFF